MLFAFPQGEKGLQAVQGTKPAIITASRPITKMIVTQPKSMSSGSQSTATKIIPTKIVYGQQGKTQVTLQQQLLAPLLRVQLQEKLDLSDYGIFRTIREHRIIKNNFNERVYYSCSA